MKGSFKLHEAQQHKKEKTEEAWIHQPICCICNRKCEGYHGRWGNTGTCDSACEKIQAAKPKYPGHSEEEFFNRLNESEARHVRLLLPGEAA